MLIRVMIDYDNNTESWWVNGGHDLWAKYSFAEDKYHYLNLNDTEAVAFYKEASSIDGWENPDAPVFAKFPIRFKTYSGEDAWFDGERFVTA